MPLPSGKALQAVSPDLFREVIRHLAAGVAVVTSSWQGIPVGLTATAVCSVSAAPPMLLASLSVNSHTTPGVQESGAFAVHLLRDTSRRLAEQFAAVTGEHFEGISYTIDKSTGIPILDNALGYFICAVERAVPIADHIIFIGRVVDCRLKDKAPRPLLYFDRNYRKLASGSETEAQNLEPWGTEENSFPGWRW